MEMIEEKEIKKMMKKNWVQNINMYEVFANSYPACTDISISWFLYLRTIIINRLMNSNNKKRTERMTHPTRDKCDV